MGGVCWISPWNCESASSTFSRVTCRQGAVRTRAPSLSYESVSHPSKHVVRYSYEGISLCARTRTKCAPLHNPRNRSISSCLFQHRPLRSAVIQRTTPRTPNQIRLTEDAICERIQRASLSDFHIISPRPLFTRRLLEFCLVNKETRVIYELFQFVQDVHGRWSGRLYYAKEAR
jgi:hypothetical protein